VVLTGVDITSYAPGLPGAPRLGKLVKQIRKHSPTSNGCGLSSIDSVEADADLLGHHRRRAPLMPQSAPLAPARRRPHPQAHEAAPHARPTRSRSTEQCAVRPDIVSAANIIAGSRPRARRASALARPRRGMRLTHLHVFPYSERAGTPAARMPQCRIRSARSARVCCASTAKPRCAPSRRQIGAQRRVLTERGGIGRTEQFTAVRLGAETAPGQMLASPSRTTMDGN